MLLMRIESKEYNDALASLSKSYYVIAVVNVGHRSAKASDLPSQWGPEQLEEQGQEIQSGRFSRTLVLKRADETISPTRMVSGKSRKAGLTSFFSRGPWPWKPAVAISNSLLLSLQAGVAPALR
jgi:hypothetical protein